MIRTAGLKKIYRTQNVETTALSSVDLQVNEGDFISVMGPSGCGKSTLLHILGLLDNPTEGDYRFRGEDVSRYGESKRALLRRGNIGFVFQGFNLIDELTVYENTELPLLYLKMSGTVRRRRVEDVLEYMGITHRKNHYPQQLSGGQQQRVALARAVIAKPGLILADEPTGNLDSTHGHEVMELLRGLNKSGATIVMVTHSEHYAAYGHRTVHLFDGHILPEADREKLRI